jgi:protein-S-isoprenylcysteine O-methyltransferase Ste14
MFRNLLKSVLHNLGVAAVSVVVALLGVGIDHLLGLGRAEHGSVRIIGCVSFIFGFLLRLWAAFYFYERQMKVIAFSPQRTLITTGPFHYSRNPLYLGGNAFMFLGASLWFGTASGIAITLLHLPLVDRMIRREEHQLEKTFGDEWSRYRRTVRRWI